MFVRTVKHWMKDSVALYNLTRNHSEGRLLDLIFFFMQENQAAVLQTGMRYICNGESTEMETNIWKWLF